MAGDNRGISRCCDLVSLGGVLRICEMEIVLLGGKVPQAIVGSCASSDAILCSGELDFDFRGRFALPPEWCLLGFIHDTPGDSWCHGTPLAPGMAFTIVPEGLSEFMLCKGSRISVVLLPLERLRQRLTQIDPYLVDQGARQLALFRVPDEESGLPAYFEQIRQGLMDETGDDAGIDQLDLDAVLNAHLSAGLSGIADSRPQCSRSRRTHYLIVQRVEQYMRANLRHDIYSNEMCAAAGVSERTLRYAFDDMLHISPNRYLSMLRLCTACRSLTLSDASRRSVKSVALSCGLWDLSRFADNYRRVFGELPRDTLMRAPLPDYVWAD